MDDESQRLGLLPLPTRKTQLTYDRALPLVVLVSFSHCALRWVGYNGGVGLVILVLSRSRRVSGPKQSLHTPCPRRDPA